MPSWVAFGGGDAPGHAGSVVGDADLAVGAEEDDAAVAAEAGEEVVDGGGGGGLRGALRCATRSTAHLPRTSFMMGSPQPVRETAAERLSA